MSKTWRRGKREREARKRHRRGGVYNGIATKGVWLKLGSKKFRIYFGKCLCFSAGG